MTIRTLLAALAAITLVPIALVPIAFAADDATTARPNIIVILADDMGWADIGYHDSEIRTPNLDQLAADGVRLNQHYAYPTCSPTRVALLSGRYPSRFDVLAPLGSTTHMRGVDARLPQTLQAAGYRTHISGKWHIGETPEHRPLRYGFDSSYGYLRGQIDPYTHRYKFGDHVTWHRNDEFVEEDGHVTDLITEEAIRVIEASDEEPFFLYVCHHSPHYPLNEPPKWIDPYEDTIDDVWRRHYAGAITHLDDGVGQIVETLERTGKRDQTLIIFSSDNGGQRSWSAPDQQYNGRYAAHTTLGNNEPLRGWKGDLYEGGIRIPALVHWPGTLEAGRVVDHPTHTCDWAPTLITLAAGSVDDAWELDGENVWPLLRDPEPGDSEPGDSEHQPTARTLYWRTRDGAAVRDGDWKLIQMKNRETPELFDLAEDPHEQTNLADREPERVKTLGEKLDQLRADDWSGE